MRAAAQPPPAPRPGRPSAAAGKPAAYPAWGSSSLFSALSRSKLAGKSIRETGLSYIMPAMPQTKADAERDEVFFLVQVSQLGRWQAGGTGTVCPPADMSHTSACPVTTGRAAE
jgi:hypothetical protein